MENKMDYPMLPEQPKTPLKGEVRKAMKPVIEHLIEKMATYEVTNMERQAKVLELIEGLAKSIPQHEAVDMSGIEQALEQLLNKDTTVNVAAPNVRVDSKEVDFTEVTKAIAGIKLDMPMDGFCPEDYSLVMRDDGDGTINYYGYEKYTGEWYIMRESVKTKRLDYCLGKAALEAIWPQHNKLKFGSPAEAYKEAYG